MKAIKINNEIKLFRELPKTWTLNDGQIINNFRNASAELIYDLGFRDLITPNLTEYQRLGNLIESGDVFSYEVIEMTQEEKDEYDAMKLAEAENALDSDISAQYEGKLIMDGEIAYKRFKDRVRREFSIGNLTLAEYKLIRKYLSPALYPLMYGDWDIAQDNLNALQEPSKAKLLAILNFVKDKVNQYILDNY